MRYDENRAIYGSSRTQRIKVLVQEFGHFLPHMLPRLVHGFSRFYLPDATLFQN